MKRKRIGMKRMIASILALSITCTGLTPIHKAFALDKEKDISWSQKALDDAKKAGYEATGLAYRTSVSGINLEYGALGNKQYLSVSGSKYNDFTNRLIYCINYHGDNGGTKVEGTQAFHSNTYNVDQLPGKIISGVSAEQKKFNFLVLTYAAAYKSKQDPKTLDPYNANVGVDILVTCGRLVTLIAEYAPLTGNWEEDFDWYKSLPYKEALGAVGPVNYVGDDTTYRQLTSTDIPQWARDRGCVNRAQAIFCYVWTAAKFSSHVTIENNRDTWRYEAALEEDGLYHVRIPFDGDNQHIIEYLRILQTECYGDWTSQADSACIHLVSPTGETPSEGSIARMNSPEMEGIIGRNLSEAKLDEFKFYCYGTRNGVYGFDNTQTYFSAVMEQPLEIYLVLGSAPSGGSMKIEVQRYEHDESWNADYKVGLNKFDAETGKPLEGVHFDILEAFDDTQLDDSDLDLLHADGMDVQIGSLNSTGWGDDSISSNYDGDTGLVQTNALKYNWANDAGSQFERWEDPTADPCIDDDNVTDKDGHLTCRNGLGVPTGEPAHFDVRSYRYHKGYCGGHPAPVIEYEEPDEEEDGDGEDVDAYNQQLHEEAWAAWYQEIETCAALAEEGGFFHAIDSEIAKEVMETDRDQFYEDFISLTYDYSARETVPRKGYILHDLHPDDIPVEWRTVTSSQYKDFVQNGISRTGEKSGFRLSENSRERGIRSEAEPEGVKNFAQPGTEELLLAGAGKQKARPELPRGRVRENPGKEAVDFLFIDESGYHADDGEEASDSARSTASNARATKSATPSDAKTASPSDALPATAANAIQRSIRLTGLMHGRKEEAAPFFPGLFAQLRESREARESVAFLPSEASSIEQGTDNTMDWTFILYNHRTEGEVHINKRDLELEKHGEEGYDSCGDTQGDAALEGAVYGLFASEAITHPDGKSGVVFQKDNLVSIAATDKNGDASFPSITEAPGTCFNFRTGRLEPTGFTGPGNLYSPQSAADGVEDNERFEGYSADGAELSIADSRAGDGTWYQKLSSNQGVDGTGEKDAGYPIQNNEENNKNCWIGRPLILGREGSRYYVMELSRSEGYELSRYGVDAELSNREADAAGDLPSSEGTVSVSAMDYDKKEGYNQFTVTSKGTTNGYDILVSDLAEGAKFYLTEQKMTVDPGGTHTEQRLVKEPVYGLPGSQVIIGGTAVEAAAGDHISLPNGTMGTVQRVSEAKTLRIGVRPANAFQVAPPAIAGEAQPASPGTVMDKVNSVLKKAGYKEPEEGSPWILVSLSGTTEAEWCQSVSNALGALRAFNAVSLEEIYQDGGLSYGLLRYTYLQAGTAPAALYDESRHSVWVKKPIAYIKGGAPIDGYLYAEYPENQCEAVVKNSAGFLTAATVKKQILEKDNAFWRDDLSLIGLKDEHEKSCWVYGDHDQAYDNNGNPVYSTRYESIETAPGYEEKVTETQISSEYNPDTRTYTVHIPPEQIPENGIQDYRIRYGEEYVPGINLPYPCYVQENAILSVLPSLAAHGSYIEHVTLLYPGQEKVYQDAGTREHPAQVFERVIKQKIKIVKDIETTPEGTYAHNTNADSGHTDGFVGGPGGPTDSASKLDNFRFKVYLKSNLERLYRNEAGAITWMDREGNEREAAAYRASYPELDPFGSVQKLYTKVPHRENSLTAGSINNNVWETAITANTELYSYDTDGRIRTDQNTGYTRLLETARRTMEDGAGKTRVIEAYNYEKFFDAVQTANHDKWDLAENAEASDTVRQFAITWYLDDEAAKLTEENGRGENQPAGGSENYSDEIYDRALSNAMEKAKNYLKPFFTYDLDEIYAIEWDSEAAGGSDKDTATLAASTLFHTSGNGLETSRDGYYYGVSKYLPYGVYVAVEQQPYRADLGDFYNRHYKTDRPKEIILPSVYEPDGNEGAPEKFNHTYDYSSADSPEELQRKYHIRLNGEWADTHTDDLRNYVIRAHNVDGDFEVYKYGLDSGRLTGVITYPGGSCSYEGFTITQDVFDPYKDIYGAENAASAYKSNQAVEKYYHYGAVSEMAGVSDNVLYPQGTDSDDNNPSGFYFKDHVKTMTGALTACDGKYAAALVPWTVTDPADAGTYDADGFAGYADGKYRNTFYAAKLRIEKLDSETGENILHDGALFAIYSAGREDGLNSEGRVKFYGRDTVIAGSREFLEAMGAYDITSAARPSLPWQIPYKGKYYGTVRAGTPVCREAEQVILSDAQGQKTGRFRVFATTRDQEMQEEKEKGEKRFSDQNTGYLETPQPLGAGCYVLAELKAPAGYTRSRPIAIEVYSDQVSYYLNGGKDERVLAAIYENDVTKTTDNGENTANPDGTRPNGNKPQDKGDTARIYINNTPIRLEVTKAKPDESEAVYELNQRLEGSLTELKAEYGLENVELACNASGKYLGYGWRKGFLDTLKKKQEAGEEIEILYEDGVFSGKARLHQRLSTADDKNRYLPGAEMTLYDAVEIKPNGDREDYSYDGVNVERDRNGNVSRMYIQKGYAGTKIRYVLDKTDPDETGEEDYKNYRYDNQEDDKGDGVWIAKTVEREDTDILFFDLGGLEVLSEKGGILYGRSKSGKQIQVKNGEPIFAFKNGTPFLEIICEDYRRLHYNSKDHVFDRVPEKTKVYHLDPDGIRDSEADPYTGMAFVVEEDTGKLLAWPVKISFDTYGNVIAREKIVTNRIAAIHADTEEEYTAGTYDSDAGRLEKRMNPVLDEHGLPKYYQKSDETYRKGRPVYDRDKDYVRYKYDDKLTGYNDNAYQVENSRNLMNIGEDPERDSDDAPLYHRQGECFLMDNIWITGEKSPNDPFTREMTDGQVDVLKRVYAGTYIMEETRAPEGYGKTMPVGITVSDSQEVRTVRAIDRPITAYFEKLDAPADFRKKILDRDHILEEERSVTEGKGSFRYQPLAGAILSLYRARRVPTKNLSEHPLGYYLEKRENKPASWPVFDDNNKKKLYTATWTTGEFPEYLESVPKGDYILEETEAPSGYVRSSMEIEIREQEELQCFMLPDDHIRLEIYKYREENGKKLPLENARPAVLSLYGAVTDEHGIVEKDGTPQYDKNRLVEQWKTDDCRSYTEGDYSFVTRYESMFEEYGTGFERFFWRDGEKERGARRIASESTDRGESVRQLWENDDGRQVLVEVTGNLLPEGTYGNVYDFKFNYKEFKTDICPNSVSYDTAFGTHRIDYLPLNGEKKGGKGKNEESQAEQKKGYYVLVEETAPEGFVTAKPKTVVVEETADIQLFSLKNEPNYIEVEKVSEDGTPLEGARLALYRAAGEDGLLMDGAHLVEGWDSGAMKPHRISPVPYGIYYLVELEAPYGYEKMEPKRIEVTAYSSPIVTAVNKTKKGKIVLEKEDKEDASIKLAGARFEIVNQGTKESFSLTTDDSGKAESEILTIGRTDENGKFLPYRFTVRELAPPDTYQMALEAYEFQFQDNGDGKLLTYVLSVPNAHTEIAVSKSVFGSSLLLKGAALAVYGTKMKDGKYEAEGDALEEWVSDGKPHLIRGKLSAGRTYLLRELEAPNGYNLAKPLIFTISDDGKRIAGITDDRDVIKLQTSGSFIGALESMTVLGRRAGTVETVLTDLDTGKKIQIPSWRRNPLTKEDGLLEGNRYEKKEYTYYSDGNSLVSARTIFRLHFTEEGTYPVNLREAVETRMRLENSGGELLETWRIDNSESSGYAHTIYNPEYEDSQGVEAISANGRYGAGVMAGSVIKYQINWKNTSRKENDIRITAELSPQTEYMEQNSTPGGREFGGRVTWTIHEAASGESGSVLLTTAVKEGASGCIVNRVTVGKDNYSVLNPLMAEGELTIRNLVSGTARAELEKQEYSYQVVFLDPTGEPLKGYCRYTGGKEGRLKSGDTVTLNGGEFLTLTGMPWGTRYQVSGLKQKSGGESENRESGTEGIIGKNGANALFLYRKNDGSVREILKKGETYRLLESTTYSDGQEAVTEEFTFRLNEQASVDSVAVEDKPSRVIITKTDITGEKELPGARFILRKENGEIIEEWISAKEPHELTAVLKPGENYILTEASPPAGYAFEEQILFTVSEDGTPDEVRMEDRPTQVEISKVGPGGREELAGAVLELQDLTGSIVEKWISDGTVHRITGRLKAGETYTLTELSAPAGYRRAKPLVFTVSENGAVDKVVMEDPPTRAIIIKKREGEADSSLLEGAHIQIKDVCGAVVYQFISKNVPEEITGVLKAGDTYTAEEIEAPYGYQLAEKIEFVMPRDEEDEQVLKLCMEDKKMPNPPDSGGEKDRPDKSGIVLKKYDGVSLRGIPGAVFAVYQEDGRLFCTVTTGADGRVILPWMPPAHYTAVEIQAPDGYLLSGQEYDFASPVGEDGPKEILIPNYPAEKITIVKEDEETGERLPGARLEIWDEDGTVCAKGETDESGELNWMPRRAGSYTVTENKAPKGYQLLKTGMRFMVAAGDTEKTWIVPNNKIAPGVITAFYEPDTGWLDWKRSKKPHIPGTGDENWSLWEIAVGLSASLVLAYCAIRKRRGLRGGKRMAGRRRKKIDKKSTEN